MLIRLRNKWPKIALCLTFGFWMSGFLLSAMKSDFYLYMDRNQPIVRLFDRPELFNEISYSYQEAKHDVCATQKPENAVTYKINVDSEARVSMMYCDRKSDKLIVFGQGLCMPKERWRYVAQLFDSYDVILFDYRWHKAGFATKWHTLLHPCNALVFDEHNVVMAAVRAVEKIKKHTSIIGLAECYSCFTFAQAQAACEMQGLKLFDKLIFDSAFISLEAVSDSSIRDPEICCRDRDTQPASCPLGLEHPWLCAPLMAFSHVLSPAMSMRPFLEKISVPILFIHGKDDVLISLKTFMREAWSYTHAPKALVVTPYPHARSRTDWGVYQFLCEHFIQSTSAQSFFDDMKGYGAVVKEK